MASTYVAISTINAQNLGWTIFAKGDNKSTVLAEAQEILKLVPDQYGNVSMEAEVLLSNLRVVSKTKANRVYGLAVDGEFEEMDWYNYHAVEGAMEMASKYRVEQHDPNSWHSDGSPCIIGTGYDGNDLREALIDADCRNLLQGEGKPRYKVVSDSPEYPMDEYGRQLELDQAIDAEDISEENVFDALQADHGQSPADAAKLLGWPEPYEQYA